MAPHDPTPLPCGIYRSTPRFENTVHAMEHGAVAIWYSPALLTADGVAELEEIAAKHLNDEVYLILAPYGSLDSTVVLTAWGERMTLGSVEERAIDKFIDEFKHDAPEPVRAGGCPGAL